MWVCGEGMMSVGVCECVWEGEGDELQRRLDTVELYKLKRSH